MIRVHYVTIDEWLTEILEVATEQPGLIAHQNVRIQVITQPDDLAFGTLHVGAIVTDQLLTSQSELMAIEEVNKLAATIRAQIGAASDQIDLLPGRFLTT